MASHFIDLVQYCLETHQQWYHTLSWQFQRYQRAFSWRYHNLRKTPKRSEPISPPNSTLSDGLHRLPPEIRLQIYDYLFPQHYVVQPEFDNGKLRVRFGLLATTPTGSNAARFTRNDADLPSETLRMTLDDGGSFLHQTSPRLPSTKMTAGRLICGDGEAWHIHQCPNFFGGGAWTSLLRTSKLLHREAVNILYSRHTFSFFGPEMLQVFLDQASLEGLRAVRHMHLAVPLSSQASSIGNALDFLAQTMKRVELEMPGLQHLDVEIVAQHGQPHNSALLWRRVSTIFEQLQLRQLEDFVLKISVLRKDVGGKKIQDQVTGFKALDTWDVSEYGRIKALVTSGANFS